MGAVSDSVFVTTLTFSGSEGTVIVLNRGNPEQGVHFVRTVPQSGYRIVAEMEVR